MFRFMANIQSAICAWFSGQGIPLSHRFSRLACSSISRTFHLLIASPLITSNRVSAFVFRQTSSGDSHGYNTEHTGNHEVYQRAHYSTHPW